MIENIIKIFKKDKFLIGMVHLGPLNSKTDDVKMSEIVDNAISDAQVYQKVGYDGVLIENNYDFPHEIFVSPKVSLGMGYVIGKVKEKISIPMGVCVLWNDYKSALTLAKLYSLQFIRIAVFVDFVETDFGKIYACFKDLNEYKKEIGAEDVLIFTDIQVKHSIILNERDLSESALEAIEKGSDGLIITGRWTADVPSMDKLCEVRNKVGNFPIIIGSGADINNVEDLLTYTNGIIVGTSIKEGEDKDKTVERNIKPYDARIDFEKAQNLQKKFAERISRL